MFKTLTIGFIASLVTLSVAVGGLQGCKKTYPEHAGRVITRLVGTDMRDKEEFYSIYVMEYEPGENGEEVIKCYEVSEEEYHSLEPGDEYVPTGEAKHK